MSRTYNLGRRAAAMAATRERILAATMALHAEQGIVATSYKDIARRADVGLGTVYHHFPALDDLVIACGGRLLEITRPPGPEIFAGLRSRQARLERLVTEIFAWYERYPAWRRAICDAGKLETLARGVQRRNRILRLLTEAALGDDAPAQAVTATLAVVNYEVYRTLADSGYSRIEAAGLISQVLCSGIPVTAPPGAA